MADKDIREDDGIGGEVPPLPDGPRSEGRPAARDPDPIRDGGEAEPEAPSVASEPDHAVADHQPSEYLPVVENADAEPPPDFGSDLAAEASGSVPMLERAEPDSWHTAIADALAEPDAETQGVYSTQAKEAEPSPQAEGQPAIVDRPSPFEDALHPAPAADTQDSTFTAAAQDLFRPPALEEDRSPHLITLGRRLDPALRIPRPVPPVIEPRPEPAVATLPWWKTALWRDRFRTGLRYAAYAIAGYLALVLVLIVLFRFVNPPGSMLMLRQLLTGTGIDRTWVPLGSISPHLVRAVVVSEDGRFCEHSGIDTAAIKEAIERASGGVPRGASTISMQVIKNLFLWNAKSYVRKVIEIPLTLFMEMIWPKWRVLEVYLNIAEWGPGVFGAEAAARHHFNKSASRLSEREAALLAAVLPNPVVRVAGSPGPQTSAKARVVQSRVRAYGAVATCVVSAAAPTPAAPATAVRPRTIRKATPPARKKAPADDWAPTLNFGQP